MIMKLNFLTKNLFKIETAKLALKPFAINVIPVSLDIPEIQANSNIEIARHGAITAAKMLNEPVMREDHGFYLHAFPGWPGPYMAHTERIIPPEDLLKLIEDKNLEGYFEMALAYALPNGEFVEYSYQLPTTMATEVRSGNKDFGWDTIICLGEEKRALSEYPAKDRYKFFTNNFVALARKLKEENV